jgi:hypothetical protein
MLGSLAMAKQDTFEISDHLARQVGNDRVNAWRKKKKTWRGIAPAHVLHELIAG